MSVVISSSESFLDLPTNFRRAYLLYTRILSEDIDEIIFSSSLQHSKSPSTSSIIELRADENIAISDETIAEAISLLHEAKEAVSDAALFSSNEDIDEYYTDSIKVRIFLYVNTSSIR
jgi:hypothetical protein